MILRSFICGGWHLSHFSRDIVNSSFLVSNCLHYQFHTVLAGASYGYLLLFLLVPLNCLRKILQKGSHSLLNCMGY